MDVLVAGGTGFIGTALCEELAERDHEVTALARDPAGADLPPDVRTTAGDVTDPESIARPVEGRDAVVNLVALSPLFEPPRGLTHEAVDLGGTRNLVSAAEAAGVDRFVQMSQLGARPDADTAFLGAKGRAETVVQSSSLEGVIVRPSVVFGEGSEFLWFVELVTTPYVTALPGGGRTRFQPIWVGDLAPMLADCVEEDRAGERYDLGGPEQLTLADVTRLVYEARGRSVRIVPVPMALAKVAMSLAGPLPFVPFGADQARGLELDNTTDENDVTEFGASLEELLTLGTYLERSTTHDGEADAAAGRAADS